MVKNDSVYKKCLKHTDCKFIGKIDSKMIHEQKNKDDEIQLEYLNDTDRTRAEASQIYSTMFNQD
jgi:hypothetical protein